MQKRYFILQFVIILVCYNYAIAKTYFVAPYGKDTNTGLTLTDPLQTVAYGIAKLKAGDELFLRSGTYNEKKILINVSGTNGQHITIANYPGEKPIIDGGYKAFRSVQNLDWELYDLQKDPQENHNLFFSHPSIANEMEKTLFTNVKQFESMEASEESVEMDKVTEERLKALGYI